MITPPSAANAPENAYIHQKFLNHLITELKPTLTRIISQGIEDGLIDFDNPEALSEIALIVLAVKIDNTLGSFHAGGDSSNHSGTGLISWNEAPAIRKEH